EGDDIPTIEDVEKAIDKTRNNHAPGEDEIAAELIKFGDEPLVVALMEIIKEIWTTEKFQNHAALESSVRIIKKEM
ncbi:hypothetical protein HHI36_006190, partial [Cryptolaemus montrouzieri]